LDNERKFDPATPRGGKAKWRLQCCKLHIFGKIMTLPK